MGTEQHSIAELEDPNPMYVLCAYLTTKPDTADQVVTLLQEMAPLSLAEPGCHAYAINQSVDDPTQILIYEQYDDEAAFQEHANSEHMARIIAGQVWPLVADRRRELYNLMAG